MNKKVDQLPNEYTLLTNYRFTEDTKLTNLIELRLV